MLWTPPHCVAAYHTISLSVCVCVCVCVCVWASSSLTVNHPNIQALDTWSSGHSASSVLLLSLWLKPNNRADDVVRPHSQTLQDSLWAATPAVR